jgi:hypothetical protein
MQRHNVIALLACTAAAALLPATARADDPQWEGEYTDEWTNERPSESFDVSVDDVGPGASVTFDTFHGALSPYGQWVVAGPYGRVWRPNVAAGWRPYYYGRWEWTNEGWLWVSDEPWGWAPYHYGRWTFDSMYGWVWVPGYQWAPAWVTWRYSGDAVGWAPLAPGLSIYVTTYPFVDAWWTFVPTVRFVSVPVYRVAYAPSYTRHHFYRTAPAPARAAPRPGVRGSVAPAPAWGGPAPRTIEERVGRPIRAARVVAAPSPGATRARPGEVSIYRPEVRSAPARRNGAGAAAVPGRGRGQANGLAPSSRGEARGERSAPRGGGYAPAPRTGERRGSDAAAQPRGEPRGGGQVQPPRGGPREGGYAPAPRGNGGGERREAAPRAPPSRAESRSEPRAEPSRQEPPSRAQQPSRAEPSRSERPRVEPRSGPSGRSSPRFEGSRGGQGGGRAAPAPRRPGDRDR